MQQREIEQPTETPIGERETDTAVRDTGDITEQPPPPARRHATIEDAEKQANENQ